jgi:dGTPase
MEVAAIARNIARALRLNEDLVEAISLAHDLGHSPFGHSGEQVLNRLMKDHGGFEHNRQSLRVVEQLEQKYPRFPGLNLTWEVREGLLKHRTSYDHPDQKARASPRRSSLEAQVANLADEIAYYSHDLDDGLDARLLLEEQLWQEVAVWRSAAEKVKREHGRLPDECRRYFTIRCIIDELVQDVVLTTERQITNSGITSAEQARHYPRALAQHSARQQRLNRRLRGYLYANVYLSPAVRQLNARAAQMLTDLFQFYRKRPEEMGEGARARIETCGLHRAVCDYVAGMTDRYALGEYRRLLGGPSLLGAVNWPGPRRTFQR